VDPQSQALLSAFLKFAPVVPDIDKVDPFSLNH
jgi:hypothetical protein